MKIVATISYYGDPVREYVPRVSEIIDIPDWCISSRLNNYLSDGKSQEGPALSFSLLIEE